MFFLMIIHFLYILILLDTFFSSILEETAELENDDVIEVKKNEGKESKN